MGGPEGKSKGILDAEKRCGGGLWWLGSGRNLRATTEMTCFSISSGRINDFIPGDVAEKILNVYQSLSQLSRGLVCILVKSC